MSAQDSGSASKLGFTEAIESLTGYEEENIVKMFGKPFSDLTDISLAMAQRSLIYVIKKRAGAGDTEAKAAAMTLTVREVSDFFTEDEEVDTDAPVTEPGKDSQPAEPKPETSPPGA